MKKKIIKIYNRKKNNKLNLDFGNHFVIEHRHRLIVVSDFLENDTLFVKKIGFRFEEISELAFLCNQMFELGQRETRAWELRDVSQIFPWHVIRHGGFHVANTIRILTYGIWRFNQAVIWLHGTCLNFMFVQFLRASRWSSTEPVVDSFYWCCVSQFFSIIASAEFARFVSCRHKIDLI